jgi:ketosteroid isomerase-like protein
MESATFGIQRTKATRWVARIAVPLCALAALTTLACEKKAPVKEEASKGAPAASAAPGGSAQAPVERDDAMKPADQEAIQSLIAAWQRSQNQGDFESYQKLYAERFVGIKRVGSRASQADRAGWLKDRRAMFSRPMTVEAKDVALTGGSSFVRARFTQTFRTPTFKDEGSKELRFARSASGWQIVHEEMLTSSTGKPSIRGPEISSGEFSFVRQVPGGTLILLDRYASLNPISGKVTHVRDGVFTRAVRQELVEERFRKFVGKTFVVHDLSGGSCEVTPRELTIYGEAFPHFGMINEWDGEGVEGRHYSGDERALSAWSLVGEERWMALRAPEQCVGTWARLKELAPAELYRRQNGLEIEKAATLAFKQTEGYRKLLTSAGSELTGRQLAFTFEAENGTQFVTTSVAAGSEPCAQTGGDHFGIFRRQGATVQLLSEPTEGYSAGPLGRAYDVVRERAFPAQAVDLNRDGMPEFLFENVLFAFNGSYYAISREAKIPDFDCPC